MSQAPFWPVATDALIADTSYLTPEQFGVYALLMIYQWRNNGKPLDNDPEKLARMVRISPTKFKKIWDEISTFFEEKNEKISQKRVEKDFQKILEKITKNKKNGSKGGRAKSLKTKEPTLANAEKSLDGSIDSSVKQNGNGKGSETPSNQNQNHTLSTEDKSSSDNGERRYFFEGETIKLNTEDYEIWHNRFSAIPDFKTTLHTADNWISGKPEKERKGWFHAVPQYLNNQHQKHLNDSPPEPKVGFQP